MFRGVPALDSVRDTGAPRRVPARRLAGLVGRAACAAPGPPYVTGTAIRQLAAGAVLPEREVMVALLQDGIWP